MKKHLKYNWFILYYLSLIFSLLLMVGFIIILFLDQIHINNYKVNNNDQLFFGFYNLNVQGNHNYYYLNWIGILMAIFVIIDTIFLCINFYLYKWSKYTYYFKKYELAILTGLIIVFLVLLLILNYMNRNLIDLKDINLVSEDWLQNQNDLTKVIKFNYFFNLEILYLANHEPVFNLCLNYFGILWIVIIALFLLTIFSLFIKIEYYKNKFYIKGY